MIFMWTPMIFACAPDIDSAHISYGIRATGTYSAEGALIMTSASITTDSNIQLSEVVDITRDEDNSSVIKGAGGSTLSDLSASGFADDGSVGSTESVESAGSAESVESVESAGSAGSAGSTGDMASADSINSKENTAETIAYDMQYGSGEGRLPDNMERAADHSYTVVQGDCLWNIAKARYGSGIDYIRIYEANRSVIGDDPDLIFPGTVLVLP
ncbi:MAG: LysM peptidoglycan-binding domain-containing protein [Lachnospiraceae bacterium]|nr:LysM peptidoglycan-binding domain-containing protein [Lachnospiraceae bacterium]